MNQAGIKVTGLPGIFFDGQKVQLSLKKAEAIVFYLSIEGETTRDKLKSIFWEELDEEAASKNLRNAFYLIRKQLGEDFLLTPNNTYVSLNPAGYFQFEDSYEDSKDLLLDDLELLRDYSFKGDETFREWLLFKREDVKKNQIQKLYNRCNDYQNTGLIDDAVNMLEHIMRIDPYSEDVTRRIMELYLGSGQYSKAIGTYNQLAAKLKEELGVVPDQMTTELYDSIVTLRNFAERTHNIHKNEYFFGRYDETACIKDELDRFLTGAHFKHVLVEGDAGLGKTKLIDRVVDTYRNVQVIKVNCTYMENDLPFRPWHFLLREIFRVHKGASKTNSRLIAGGVVGTDVKWKNDFDAYSIEGEQKISFRELVEDMANILKQATKDRPLIVVFEDIHWAQGNSIQLLLEVIRERLDHVMFILSTRDLRTVTLNKFSTLGNNEKWLYRIQLMPFSLGETKAFLKNGTKKQVSEDWVEHLYKETEGNTFMLKSYLDLFNKNADINLAGLKHEDLMQSRLVGLSEKALRVLDILAIFKEYPDFDGIKNITIYDDIEIVEIIDELKNNHVIREIASSTRLYYDFTHNKLKEYVFNVISETRKVVIHRKLCLYYEEKYNRKVDNIAILPYIIYHARHARDFVMEYKYQVIYGKMYLDIWHEVFNAYYDGLEKERTFEDKVMADIEETRKRLEEGAGIDQNIKVYDYQVMYIKGRRAIREGRYSEGLDYIEKAERFFEKSDDVEMLINCNLQKIYYHIQTENLDAMENALDKLNYLVKREESKDLIYIYWRLKGLHCIKGKSFEEAERYLELSKEYLLPLANDNMKYSLNLAATYNYSAEIAMSMGDYESAAETLETARTLAERAKPTNGLALIYTNLSIANFHRSKIEMSLNYIAKSSEVYELTGSYWGRGRSEAHMARLMYLADFRDSAHEHIGKALEFASLMKNPVELSFVQDIAKEVKYH